MAEDVAEAPPARAEVRPFHNPDDMVGRFEARIDRGELPPPPGPGHNGFSERLTPYEESEKFTDKSDGFSDADADTYDDEGAGEDAVDDGFEAALSEAVTRPLQAALEAAIATTAAAPATPTAQSPEPATPAAQPPAPATVAAESATPAAAPAAPEAPQAAEPAAPRVRPGAALDPLDEEVLRPIVARLIREELQGELGERITRNVRKLVRREILRAINAQEFE
jgi:hypothetical protein